MKKPGVKKSCETVPLKGLSHKNYWVLLYINPKLFSKAIVAHHKILILLKGRTSQSTKEDPVNEWPFNSRWSAQF